MKRSRLDFEANGDASSASPPRGALPYPASEANSRRESIHVPKISRKIRACTECKRHKVRCDMKAGESVCSRCRRMGLECVVNKSLQTLLDDEAEYVRFVSFQPGFHQAVSLLTRLYTLYRWKTTIELAMADLLRKAQLPELSYYQAVGKSAETPHKKSGRRGSTVSTDDIHTSRGDVGRDATDGGAKSVDGISHPPSHTTQQRSQIAIDREEKLLVTAPMGSLYEVTQLSDIQERTPERHHTSDRDTDLISRGTVDPQEAEELFCFFDQVLNRYLWDGIALVHKDLTSVRNSSSMLSAAILAVTALHMPQKERLFDTCYTEFAKLASESMLDRHHTLDDLRALCIGAFWLADVSWKLSGI
ncbi:unnamed protein product [Aspergillus oryzae RIB40]|uniref:DNA, SC020 n=1 Tax=Aspergillus oryzae (strain ATCC 42149 / RIB 40) TaxID=510516 RepID=Q2U546_ASPOR|nr:unnamed protein product [Aspergillus oryzae RIB40]BAE63319.1 unnamed protein product [Aspergillus oryzae RIB40]